MVEFVPVKEVVDPRRTVRVIIQNPEGSVLLLQRSNEDRLWEFPGGELDRVHFTGPEALSHGIFQVGIRAVNQVTGINLSSAVLRSTHNFCYGMQHPTRVFVIKATLQRTSTVELNQRRDGQEKKYDDHKWVTIEQLWNMRREGRLSRSSRNYEPALGFLL